MPAVSGPYDLGNVVVRVGDPGRPDHRADNGGLRSDSRRFSKASRCGCARSRSTSTGANSPSTRRTAIPFSVDTSLAGNEGAVATPQRRFQVANCTDLAFGPKLGLQLLGRRPSGGAPGPASGLCGPSPVKRTSARSSRPCRARSCSTTLTSRAPAPASSTRTIACPAGSRIGSATAESPLLGEPLSGPVYLRSGSTSSPTSLRS